MDKIAKAIGAAQGGALTGTAIIALLAALFPAGMNVPWWGYLIGFVAIYAVSMGAPALTAYLAPANLQPAVGDTVTATTPAKVVSAVTDKAHGPPAG